MRIRHIAIICLLLSGVFAMAQDNNKILNRPYADMKLLHFGFSIGAHTQDMQFTHNGYKTEGGETWVMEIPDFSPGFCVNVLADLRLGKHFNLRLSPGMYFGNKVVKFVDTTNGGAQSQNVKTNYVVIPIDLKVSSERYRNLRPYVIGGVMATFDVSKKRSDLLMFNTTDLMLTFGFGCDIYLPYFKLIPEVKFCFGLADIIKHDRPDLSDDPGMMKYTNSLKKATSNMVVLTFYFE
ncbi:MAG: porin family protein [Muribaculaceae bacterium]